MRVYTDGSCTRPDLEVFWIDEVVLPELSVWARIKRNRVFKTLVSIVTGVAQAVILALILSGEWRIEGSPLLVAVLGIVLGLAAMLEGLVNVMEGRDRERLADRVLQVHRETMQSSPGYAYAYNLMNHIIAALVEAYCRGSPILVYGPVVIVAGGRQGRFQVIKPRV